MEILQPILDQIPIRHDWASHIMLLGIVQAYFLSLVIFIRTKRKSALNILAWSILLQAIVCTDTYLCYTGLMKYTIIFNDSTETLVFLIATTIYFFIYELLEKKAITFKKHWYHFILPVVYVFSQIEYFLSPYSVKLNAYISAYHSNIPSISDPPGFNNNFLILKDQLRWLILLNFIFYLILSVRLIIKNRKSRRPASKKIRVDKFTYSVSTVVLLVLFFGFLTGVFANYDDDGGDHYIVMFVSVMTFISSFFILIESRFFDNTWIADKYDTLATITITFSDIEFFLQTEKYFLSQNVSLKDLAEKLQTSPNSISKLINTETGLNFNDYINQKRITITKNKLLDTNFANLTVEAIGLSVGFRSKSAFYNAFKKHVGSTPTQYIKQQST